MGAAGSTTDLSHAEYVEVTRLLRLEYEKCKTLNLSSEEFQQLMTSKFKDFVEKLQDFKTQGLQRTNTMELLRLSEFMSSSLKGFEFNTKDIEPLSERPDGTPRDPWTETMNIKSVEVEFLIRRPLNTDEDISYTLAAAEAGLLFMDELSRVSSSLKLNRGALTRWLLPFDTSSAASDQISSVDTVIKNIPESLKGKLSDRQIHYLVSGVNGVRQLVRVKIADENDLEQAKQALLTTRDFCLRLQTEAATLVKHGQNITPYELYHAHSL